MTVCHSKPAMYNILFGDTALYSWLHGKHIPFMYQAHAVFCQQKGQPKDYQLIIWLNKCGRSLRHILKKYKDRSLLWNVWIGMMIRCKPSLLRNALLGPIRLNIISVL